MKIKQYDEYELAQLQKECNENPPKPFTKDEIEVFEAVADEKDKMTDEEYMTAVAKAMIGVWG